MNPLTLVKRIQNINSKEAALGISEEASWHAKYKDSAYVFVGGISFDLTEGDLLAVFAQYGEVVDVNLVRDKGTGKSKGFAFLAYEDQRSTNLAVDNLNGAQINGRIIRVDHVTKYKKKEEEDEETERQKREARGVCRAFQRGECTRGAGCKFSHDEQRAADTGWGHQDTSPRWGHEKFEGPKKGEKISSSVRTSENYRKVSDSRQEKTSRRQDDYEFGQKSGEDYRREGKNLEMHGNDKFDYKSREDCYERDEKSLRGNKGDEFQPKAIEDENRFRRRKEDEFVVKAREDEKRLRRNKEDEFELKAREDEKRLRRNKGYDFEPKSREDEKRKRRHDSESYREEQSRRGGDKSSAYGRVSPSRRHRERDDHRHKFDR